MDLLHDMLRYKHTAASQMFTMTPAVPGRAMCIHVVLEGDVLGSFYVFMLCTVFCSRLSTHLLLVRFAFLFIGSLYDLRCIYHQNSKVSRGIGGWMH